jgi:hypothetical protein
MPLGGNALAKYNDKKQKLLGGGYLTSASCAQFFADPKRPSYLSQLSGTVTNQIPHDDSNLKRSRTWEKRADNGGSGASRDQR